MAAESLIPDAPSYGRLQWYAEWLDFIGMTAESAAAVALLDEWRRGAIKLETYRERIRPLAAALRGEGWHQSAISSIPVERWRLLAARWSEAACYMDAEYVMRGQGGRGVLLRQLGPQLTRGSGADRTDAAVELMRSLGPSWIGQALTDLEHPPLQIGASENSSCFNSTALDARGLLAPVGQSWVNIGFEPGDPGWVGEAPEFGAAFRAVIGRLEPGSKLRLVSRAIQLSGYQAVPDTPQTERVASLVAALNRDPPAELVELLRPLFATQEPTETHKVAATLEIECGMPEYSIIGGGPELAELAAVARAASSILGMPCDSARILSFLRGRGTGAAVDLRYGLVLGSGNIVNVELAGPAHIAEFEPVKSADIRTGDVICRINGAEIKFPKLPLNGFVFQMSLTRPIQDSDDHALLSLHGRWGGPDTAVNRAAAAFAAELWQLHRHGVIRITDAIRTPAAAVAAAATIRRTTLLNAINSARAVDAQDAGRQYGGAVGKPLTVKSQRGEGWLAQTGAGELFARSRVSRAVALERFNSLLDKYEQHHLPHPYGSHQQRAILPDWEYINGPDWVRAHFDTWMQVMVDRQRDREGFDLVRSGAEQLGWSLDPEELYHSAIEGGLVRLGLEPLRRYRAARVAGAGDIAAYRGMAEPKLRELYDLNSEILAGHIRFRVLEEGDPAHFVVGADTNCCQVIGGAGEDAAVQSYVNSHAGVLVLEAKFGDEWTLVAQSYFHWVPGDSPQYILDNVEHNEAAVQHLERIYSTDLRSIYALLGAEVRARLPHVASFVAGKSHSKIGNSEWASHAQERDPRRYRNVDTDSDSDDDDDDDDAADDGEFAGYSDYDPADAIDLTNPRFAVVRPSMPK